MKITEIIYLSQTAFIICDGKCGKAWGINVRPRNGKDEMLKDNELEEAPINPGTYEGGDGKNPLSHNRWCARECERSTITGIKNMPWKQLIKE